MKNLFLKKRTALSDKELSLLFYRLGALLKAGISLSRALKFLAVQSNKKIKNALDEISLKLEKGVSFSSAFCEEKLTAQHVENSLKIAEENSFLDEVLIKFAEFYDKRNKFYQDFKKAIAYPSIVMCSSFLSFLLMIWFVLPTYSKIFSDFEFELPLITKIAVSLPEYLGVFTVFLVFSFGIFLCCLRNIYFRMNLPIAGHILRQLMLSDICFELSCQLKNGVSFSKAFNNVIEGVNDNHIKQEFNIILHNIKEGVSLSRAFSENKIFGGAFLGFLSIGEETGNLYYFLSHAGEHFLEEVQISLKNITSYVEPLTTLMVGGVVAFIAVSVIMPLFSIVNLLL